MEVTSYTLTGTGRYAEWAEVDWTGVDAQGRYTLAGPASCAYRLEFVDYSGVLLDEYWDDAPDIDEATDVRVTSGTTQSGKDAALAVAPPLVNTARPVVQRISRGRRHADGRCRPVGRRPGRHLVRVAARRHADRRRLRAGVRPHGRPGRQSADRSGHAWAPGRRIAEVRTDPVVVSPAAPSSMQATRRAPTTLGLSWSAAPGASGYRLTIRTDTRARTVLVNNTTNSFLSGLEPARVHTITVEAISADGRARTVSCPVKIRTR